MDESIDEEELYSAEFSKEEVAQLAEEDQEAFWSEQQRAEEAMEVIRAQKATLKEARWKQKQIKLGRNFFPPKPYGKSRGKGSSGKEDGKYFKCGGPHFQRDCPQNQEARVADEAAEIVFTATEVTSEVDHEVHSAKEEARFGSCGKGEIPLGEYGIIDSGATASLGSVDAMEAWREANVASCGQSRMSIDPSVRPVFKFGNGQRKTWSTVQVGIGAGKKRGSFEVHVHDSPGQPVLVSRKALRSLGAIVDFSNNQAIYTKVDPTMVVDLNEAANGHLLMPLTGNLLNGGVQRKSPLTSLVE